ncbi:MAG TPA: patatin-like phospholipase family protein [Enhygromyxa sp.]|nr:patatin-like phospholipase family protein [Enhygromyxa sp.]
MLSAGGVRGAYQVGVIAGIVELLGHQGAEAPLFDIFVGSSVGAINAAYLAANADRSDHAIGGLEQIWTKLDFDEILQLTPLGAWGWPRLRLPGRHEPRATARYVGRSLFDPRPVERLLDRVIAWDRLHENIRAARVRGLMIAALDICDGATTVFTELAEGVTFRPYPYLTTRSTFTAIEAEHVLAATALPFIFPARHVEDRYYMDGAIRFETPIIPALRAGAERVVIISLLDQAAGPEARRELVFPGVFFLIGQLLNAVLLDPLLHDKDNLHRNNRIIEVMADTLDPATTIELIAKLESEVPPGRPVPTLVFRPSASIEAIAADFLQNELRRRRPLRRALLRRLADFETGQALLASFLFFDGRLAARLIELGRGDAIAQRDRILAFFEA